MVFGGTWHDVQRANNYTLCFLLPLEMKSDFDNVTPNHCYIKRRGQSRHGVCVDDDNMHN